MRSLLYLANTTLLKRSSDDLAFTGIGRAWSLTVEECFYLLAPLLFWLGRRFSPVIWVAVMAGLLAVGCSPYGNIGIGLQSAHFMLVATIFGCVCAYFPGQTATPGHAAGRPGATAHRRGFDHYPAPYQQSQH